MNKRTIMLIFTLALFGCSDSSPTSISSVRILPTPSSTILLESTRTPILHTIVYQGAAAYMMEKQACAIILTGESLARQWDRFGLREAPPDIDFDRHRVLVIYEGFSSNPTNLDIIRIAESSGIISVEYGLNIHPQDEEGIPKALVVSVPVGDASLEVMRHEWLLGTHTVQIVDCE